jgi:glycosyltransferase involved in cell wall biosynthesis
VVAVNEEVAALVVRHKGKLFQALVLDIHDELELRSYTESFAVTSVSRLVAKYARRNADRIICVAEERLALLRPADQRKAVCVHNFPCTPARPIRENITRRDAFSIYVGGSLGEQRGLATLLAAAEMVGARIVSAGRLLDAYARDVFAKHPAVQYNGHVAPERAMELLAGCSASVVFFEPGPKVVELAASNKVYEALFVGRPILANREMGTAPWIVREQVGYAVPYADSAALADVFREIQTDKDGWQNMCRRARRTFEAGAYSWESQEPVLFKMLDDLIQKRG